MKSKVVSLLLCLSLILASGCGEKQEPFPIEAKGDIPAGLASFPDEDFMLVGSLNAASFFKSDLGNFVSSRYPAIPLAAVTAGINLKEDISEISFAMKFESRAFPQPYNTYQFLVYMNYAPREMLLDSLMQRLHPETTEKGGGTLYSFVPKGSVFGENNPLFLYNFKGEELLFSNNKELMEKAIAVKTGQGQSLSASRAVYPLAEKMNKEAAFWLVVKQSLDSRNLLQMFIEPFDECYVKIDVNSRADVLCIMKFEEAELARQAVKRHGITLKSLDKMEAVFDGMSQEEQTAIGILTQFLRTVTAEMQGDMAIYRSSVSKEMFSSMQAGEEKQTGERKEGDGDEEK